MSHPLGVQGLSTVFAYKSLVLKPGSARHPCFRCARLCYFSKGSKKSSRTRHPEMLTYIKILKLFYSRAGISRDESRAGMA
jgi:hypothetical protein